MGNHLGEHTGTEATYPGPHLKEDPGVQGVRWGQRAQPRRRLPAEGEGATGVRLNSGRGQGKTRVAPT